MHILKMALYHLSTPEGWEELRTEIRQSPTISQPVASVLLDELDRLWQEPSTDITWVYHIYVDGTFYFSVSIPGVQSTDEFASTRVDLSTTKSIPMTFLLFGVAIVGVFLSVIFLPIPLT